MWVGGCHAEIVQVDTVSECGLGEDAILRVHSAEMG